MSRIIGCRDLHIATLIKDELGQVVAYQAPTRVPSLVNVSVSDKVEQSKFYSDDNVEQAFSKTSGKEVTIELGYITNELEALITGKTFDAATGVMIQKGDDTAKEVALLFRAPKSKGGFRYMALYKGTLTRTESEYKTQEDKVDSATVTLVGTFIPLQANGLMSSTVDSDDTASEATVKDWFTKVYIPGQVTP